MLLEWLQTGRFPREEFRVRAVIAVPFAVIVSILTIAVLVRAAG